MKAKPWKIRAVQLDLARQMENLDYIKSFIDFIAEYDYNALLLYLEGRVKTKSFPYPSERESYSPEEMSEIVTYAGAKGMDVIPAIQALGHAELFLKHPELAPLWELRDTGGFGRWKGKSHMPDTFCPSLPETKEFLQNYMEDLVEIFPSQYFHAGLDEAWHMGVCDRCRKHPGGQEGIFAETVQWLHAVVCAKHGKRMMLWDDMFERYPGALEKTPRDVILCCWHYNSAIDCTRHHFSTCRENFPAKYRSMGFDTLIAPWERSLHNIITFTDFARGNEPLGGLVTTWEKKTSFLLESYPNIAYAGRAWQTPAKNGEALARACIAEFFGVSSAAFVDAVLAAGDLNPPSPAPDMERYLRGPMTAEELRRERWVAVLCNALSAARKETTGTRATAVLDDLLSRYESYRIFLELRRQVPVAYGPDPAPDVPVLEALAGRIRSLAERRRRQWAQWRTGLDDGPLNAYYSNLENKLSALTPGVRTGLLTVRCFMPFVAQDSRIRVRYTGESTWETVAEKRLCPLGEEAFYRIDFPVAIDKVPEAVRFSTWGYGFQGITFVSVHNAIGRFVPASVFDLWGEVHHPLHVLWDDDRWVSAGAASALESYSDLPGIVNQVEHGMEIRLAKAEDLVRVTRYSKKGKV